MKLTKSPLGISLSLVALLLPGLSQADVLGITGVTLSTGSGDVANTNESLVLDFTNSDGTWAVGSAITNASGVYDGQPGAVRNIWAATGGTEIDGFASITGSLDVSHGVINVAESGNGDGIVTLTLAGAAQSRAGLGNDFYFFEVGGTDSNPPSSLGPNDVMFVTPLDINGTIIGTATQVSIAENDWSYTGRQFVATGDGVGDTYGIAGVGFDLSDFGDLGGNDVYSLQIKSDAGGIDFLAIGSVAIPEPATATLLLSAIAGGFAFTRRQRRA